MEITAEYLKGQVEGKLKQANEDAIKNGWKKEEWERSQKRWEESDEEQLINSTTRPNFSSTKYTIAIKQLEFYGIPVLKENVAYLVGVPKEKLPERRDFGGRRSRKLRLNVKRGHTQRHRGGRKHRKLAKLTTRRR